jgi:hypothetical protein
LKLFIAICLTLLLGCETYVPTTTDSRYSDTGVSTAGDVWINGYIRKDGSYVDGHYRQRPNSKNSDNYSTQGNTNPYTGKAGTRAQDYSPEAYNYGAGKDILTGPRGGQYYHNNSGRKVYVPKR